MTNNKSDGTRLCGISSFRKTDHRKTADVTDLKSETKQPLRLVCVMQEFTVSAITITPRTEQVLRHPEGVTEGRRNSEKLADLAGEKSAL